MSTKVKLYRVLSVIRFIGIEIEKTRHSVFLSHPLQLIGWYAPLQTIQIYFSALLDTESLTDFTQEKI
jgi:hypothetical protein